MAVTTLSAHAFESWRGKGDLGRMWLRDFLSVGLPNCRTMTYGYYSRLCSPGVHQIRDYSRGSLEELKKARMSEEVVGFCFNVSSRYFTIKDISSGPHMYILPYLLSISHLLKCQRIYVLPMILTYGVFRKGKGQLFL